MELRELGEPMQEKELLVFRRKEPVKSWGSRKVPDKRRSCYFWKKGACLISEETNKERWLLDGHKKERSVRRLPGSWCLLNSTGEDLRLVEV